MRDDGVPQPFLVAFPMEDGSQQVMLDPGFFAGLDEVGDFLGELAKQYGRAFVQSGRARDMEDALEQIREMFLLELETPDEEGDEGAEGA